MKIARACRGCLKSLTIDGKKLLDPIRSVETSVTYRDAFEFCSGYTVCSSEPQDICDECASDLFFSFRFRSKCKKTQEMLHTWVEGQIKQEEVHVKIEVFAENIFVDEQDFNETNKTEESLLESTNTVFDKEEEEDEDEWHNTSNDEQSNKTDEPVKKIRGKYRTKVDRNFKCKLCDRKYTQRNNLVQHINFKHPETKTDPCPHCKQTQYPQLMQSHIERCRIRNKGTTTVLDKEEEEDDEWHNTSNDEHSNKTNEQDSKPVKKVRGKYRTKVERNFNCKLCDRKYIQRNNLIQHINLKHPETKTDPCPHCKQTQYPQLMESHIERCRTRLKEFRHQNLPRNGSIRGKYKKRNPLIEDFEPKPAPKGLCPICGVTRSTNHITAHLARKANPNQPFICEICGAKLASRSGIFFHMQVQHLKIPFKCRYCDMEFRTVQQVETHTRKIHPQFKKVLKCDYCDYTTNYHTSLRAHRAKHTGQTFHKCNICQKEFVRKEKYNFHMALHSDERNFACEICGARFKTRRYVRIHQRTHREHDYECPVCKKTFSSNQLMTHHAKNKHPDYQLPPPGTIMSKSFRKIVAQKKLKEDAMRKGEDKKFVDAIVVNEAPPIEELQIFQEFGRLNTIERPKY